VRGCRGEIALRLIGLLLEANDPVILVELDDAVMLQEVAVSDLLECDRTAPFLPPKLDVVGERVADQVVAGDHEQVLIYEPRSVDREGEIPDRPEPVVIR